MSKSHAMFETKPGVLRGWGRDRRLFGYEITAL